MIRINLLPDKEKRTRAPSVASASQTWLLVLLALLLVEVVGLFIFHAAVSERLEDQQRKNAELKSQIQEAKGHVSNHDAVKEKLAKLREREEAIAKLESARTGPTTILLELVRILTPGRGPSVDPEELSQLRRENPLAVYNSSWDPRRIWLTKLVEDQRRVRLEGIARDGEDVSELLRRMILSSYFEDVRLLPAEKVKHEETGIQLLNFQLEATARY